MEPEKQKAKAKGGGKRQRKSVAAPMGVYGKVQEVAKQWAPKARDAPLVAAKAEGKGSASKLPAAYAQRTPAKASRRPSAEAGDPVFATPASETKWQVDIDFGADARGSESNELPVLGPDDVLRSTQSSPPSVPRPPEQPARGAAEAAAAGAPPNDPPRGDGRRQAAEAGGGDGGGEDGDGEGCAEDDAEGEDGLEGYVDERAEEVLQAKVRELETVRSLQQDLERLASGEKATTKALAGASEADRGPRLDLNAPGQNGSPVKQFTNSFLDQSPDLLGKPPASQGEGGAAGATAEAAAADEAAQKKKLSFRWPTKASFIASPLKRVSLLKKYWNDKRARRSTLKTLLADERFAPPPKTGELYDVHELLGRGSFAIVRRVTLKESGAEFAAKFITTISDGWKQGAASKKLGQNRSGCLTESEVAREVACMETLVGTAGAVQVHEVLQEQGKTIIIMDHLKGGSVAERVQQRRGRADLAFVKDLTLKVLEAVHEMHAKGIIHRDIKLANVLLGDPDAVGEVALSDFGLAIEGAAMTGSRSGTLEYMAPEIGGAKEGPFHYTPKCDMWSVGIVLFRVCFGALPGFLKRKWRRPDEYQKHVDAGLRKAWTATLGSRSHAPPQLLEIFQGLLRVDRNERWSSQKALHAARKFLKVPRTGKPGPPAPGLAAPAAEAGGEVNGKHQNGGADPSPETGDKEDLWKSRKFVALHRWIALQERNGHRLMRGPPSKNYRNLGAKVSPVADKGQGNGKAAGKGGTGAPEKSRAVKERWRGTLASIASVVSWRSLKKDLSDLRYTLHVNSLLLRRSLGDRAARCFPCFGGRGNRVEPVRKPEPEPEPETSGYDMKSASASGSPGSDD